METVSPNTCLLPVKDGGVNLTNLKLKCQALKLAGMISTLNTCDDSSFFICEYCFGSRMSSRGPEWAIT